MDLIVLTTLSVADAPSHGYIIGLMIILLLRAKLHESGTLQLYVTENRQVEPALPMRLLKHPVHAAHHRLGKAVDDETLMCCQSYNLERTSTLVINGAPER